MSNLSYKLIAICLLTLACSTESSAQYTLVGEEYRDLSREVERIGARVLIYKAPAANDDRLFMTPVFAFKAKKDGTIDVSLDEPGPGSDKWTVVLTLLVSPGVKTSAIADTIRSHERRTSGSYSQLTDSKLINLSLRNLAIIDQGAPSLFTCKICGTPGSLVTGEVPLIAVLEKAEAEKLKGQLESGRTARRFTLSYEVNAVSTITDSGARASGVYLYDTNAVKNLRGSGRAFRWNLSDTGGGIGTDSSFVMRDQKSTFEGRVQTEIGIFYDIENPDDLQLLQKDVHTYFNQVFTSKFIQIDGDFAREMSRLSSYDFDAGDIKPEELNKFASDAKKFFSSDEQTFALTKGATAFSYGGYGGSASGEVKRDVLKKSMEDKGWHFELQDGKVYVPKSLEVFVVNRTALEQKGAINVNIKRKFRGSAAGVTPIDTRNALYPESELDYVAEVERLKTIVPPIGTVMAYAGPIDDLHKLPGTWKHCDGKESLSKVTYKELYDKIACYWGCEGDTFKLPDLRGLFLRGVDGGRGLDPDAASREVKVNGAQNQVGSIQPDQFRSHSHPFRFNIGGLAGPTPNIPEGAPIDRDRELGNKATSDGVGGNETRPKNAYVHWIIRVQ